MSERKSKKFLLPIFVGMVLNVAIFTLLQTQSYYGFIVFAIVGYLGIGLFAWDAYHNPTLNIPRATVWLLGFLFLWFLCMPAYIYLTSRENEDTTE